MKKKIIILFCTLVFFALTATTIFSGLVGAKSLYVCANTNSTNAPIEAYNINANGTITYQATYNTNFGWGSVGLAIDSNSGYLFLTMEGSGYLYLINGTTMQGEGSVLAPGASNLAGIVYDHDKELLYIVDRTTDKLYSYKWYPDNKTVSLQPGFPKNLPGGYFYGIALDEINDILYAANYYNTITYYDTATWTRLGNITLSENYNLGITVDYVRGIIYTGSGWVSYSNTNLVKYDIDTGTETIVDMGYGVMGLAVDQSTGYLYITHGYSGDNVSVWDTSTSPFTEIDNTDDIGDPAGLCIPIEDVSYNPLNLDKEDGHEEECVSPGELISYEITFDNKMNEYDVHNVTILDELPSEVNYVSGGTYDSINHTVFWDIGTLPAGSNQSTLTLNVTVDSATPGNITIINYVTIDSDETPQTTKSEPTLICGGEVDITPPIQKTELGTPIIEDVYDTGLELLDLIGSKTPVWINSTDPESGTYFIKYKLAFAEEYGEWSDPDWVYVYDNQETGSPFTTDTDPENGSISIKFTLDESCFHEIHAHCINYVGLWNYSDPVDFLVDADAPKNNEYDYINSVVLGGGARYISNTSKKIIYGNDTGCNGGVAGVEKIIWRVENYLTQTIASGIVYDNDTTGYEDEYVIVSKDLDDETGKMIIEISIKEECLHFIYHRAVDYLNNSNVGIKQQVHVDITPPEIFKMVGDPKCVIIADKEYCITTKTDITFYAEERGCEGGVGINTLEYRIWNLSHGWGEGWIQVDPEATHTINIDEECMHYLEIRVHDLLCNTALDNETFYVDDSAPVIDKTVGAPNCPEAPDVDYVVTTLTPIYVNVTDPGCCPSLTVKVSEDGVNWTVVPDHYVHYFAEECYHELYVMAYDCLGHISWDNETFYVDDYAPEISKVVGEPNCPDPDGADYCVTTHTPIHIDASYGCCPWFVVEISYDGESWNDISVPYTHYFMKECYHELYIRAFDCFGRTSYDNETFYVDDSAPVIDKTVGKPNCPEANGADYVVTTLTPIYVNVTDPGCCPSLTVKVSEDGVNWTVVPDHYVHYFAEECYHELYVMAYDCLGHISWDNETFYVDDYSPEISKVVGEPNCPDPDGADYCVTTHTPIDIDVSYGCYPEFMVQISYDGENWSYISVPYTHYFEQECYHELYIRAFDCFGRTSYDNETFYVDDTPPSFTKIVGVPSCYLGKDKYGHDIWGCLTTNTEINLSAVDEGCCNLPAYIFYRISVKGYWSEWKEYTGNFTFKEGCDHWLEVNISDCLGNYIIDNETFIVHGENGPHVEIIKPEDNEILDSRDDRYAHVKIKGWYGNDKDDHNITVTLYLDDPYGAPDLYYPVEWNSTQNCFTADVDIYKYSTGSTLQLVAKGEDDYGGRDYDDVSFKVNTTVEYDRWMEKGWNGPINLAVNGCDNSTVAIFSSIDPYWDFVFEVGSWDNYWYNQEEEWMNGGTLQHIERDAWYWIHMTESARFYIDNNPPIIEVLYPEDEETYYHQCLDGFWGSAYDIETSIKEIKLVIMDDDTMEYWNGIEWTEDYTELDCDYDDVDCEWYCGDSENIDLTYRSGNQIFVTAMATDIAGCEAEHTIWFMFIDDNPPYINIEYPEVDVTYGCGYPDTVNGTAYDLECETIVEEVYIQIQKDNYTGPFWDGDSWEDDSTNLYCIYDSDTHHWYYCENLPAWEHMEDYMIYAFAKDSADNIGEDSVFFSYECEEGETSIETMKKVWNPIEFISDTYVTYVYTIADIVVFGYENDTSVSIYNNAGTLIWSGEIDEGEYHHQTVSSGVYKLIGDKKFAVLIGDPITDYVLGYYAVDNNGYGLGTKLYTYMPSSYGYDYFIVFSYTDDTDVTITNLDTSTVVWTGTLDRGEHYADSTLSSDFVLVESSNPVSALSYNDQGYFVPSADKTFCGTEFYTYSDYIGNWPNTLWVMAYEDNTHVNISNTGTSYVYFDGTLDAGEAHHITSTESRYYTVETDKDVTVAILPIDGYSSGYAHGTYVSDRTGSGIGTEFYTPSLSGGDLFVFAYENGTTVNVYNAETGVLQNTYYLDAGDSYNVNPGYGYWHITSNGLISVYEGYYIASASFAPVLFGESVGGFWADSRDAEIEETVRFKIGVHNDGDITLYDWHITDILPSGLDYIEDSCNMTLGGVPVDPEHAQPQSITTDEDGNTILEWWDETREEEFVFEPCKWIYIEFEAIVETCNDSGHINWAEATADPGNVTDSDIATVYVTCEGIVGSISGTIYYVGEGEGDVSVWLFEGNLTDGTTPIDGYVIPDDMQGRPIVGTYNFSDLEDGQYYIVSFMDNDDNDNVSAWEPFGFAVNKSTWPDYLTISGGNKETGVDVTLFDPIVNISLEKTVWDNDLQEWVDETEYSQEEVVKFNLSIHNDGTSAPVLVNYAMDDLPEGFEYVDDSGTICIVNPDGSNSWDQNPVETLEDNWVLTWEFGATMYLFPCNWIYIEFETTTSECDDDFAFENDAEVEAEYALDSEYFVYGEDTAYVWIYCTEPCEVTANINYPTNGGEVPTDTGLNIYGNASSSCSCIEVENVSIYVYYYDNATATYYNKSANAWQGSTVIWNPVDYVSGGCPINPLEWDFTIDTPLVAGETYWTRIDVYDQMGNNKKSAEIHFSVEEETDLIKVEGAIVSLAWENNSFSGSNVTYTDENGFYQMNLPCGEANVSVYYISDKYPEVIYVFNYSKWFDVECPPPCEYTKDIILPKIPDDTAIIHGYVYNNSNHAETIDASISINFYGTDFYGYNSTTCDSVNGYEINLPPNVQVSIYASADGYNSNYTFITIGDESKEVNLFLDPMPPEPPETAVVKGYVKDNDTSVGIEYAYLDFLNDSYYNSTYTDSNGYYEINLVAGEFYVSSWAEDYFDNYTDFMINSYETKWLNITLTPFPPDNAWVHVYVNDSETGSAITNAEVWVEGYIELAGGQTGYYTRYNSTYENGYYNVSVPAVVDDYPFEYSEIYIISATADGYDSNSTYPWDGFIEPGDIKIEEVILEPSEPEPPEPEEPCIVNGTVYMRTTIEEG